MSETKIVWHHYPKEMPKKEGKYLITVRVAGTNYIETDFYYINKKHAYFSYSNPFVTAWAELPEPYEGGNNG